MILLENRDEIQSYLKDKGISTGLHYPVPLHLQKAYSYLNISEGSYPVTELCATRLLSLPMFPDLTENQIYYLAECLTKRMVKTIKENRKMR